MSSELPHQSAREAAAMRLIQERVAAAARELIVAGDYCSRSDDEFGNWPPSWGERIYEAHTVLDGLLADLDDAAEITEAESSNG